MEAVTQHIKSIETYDEENGKTEIYSHLYIYFLTSLAIVVATLGLSMLNTLLHLH